MVTITLEREVNLDGREIFVINRDGRYISSTLRYTLEEAEKLYDEIIKREKAPKQIPVIIKQTEI